MSEGLGLNPSSFIYGLTKVWLFIVFDVIFIVA